MKIAKLFPGYFRLAHCTARAAKLVDARFHQHHLKYGRSMAELEQADRRQVLSGTDLRSVNRPLPNSVLPTGATYESVLYRHR